MKHTASTVRTCMLRYSRCLKPRGTGQEAHFCVHRYARFLADGWSFLASQLIDWLEAGPRLPGLYRCGRVDDLRMREIDTVVFTIYWIERHGTRKGRAFHIPGASNTALNDGHTWLALGANDARFA
jgi:hypothetical protein